MLTALAFFAWFAEFVLETRGAVLSFRQKLFPLTALLGACALGDAISFTVRVTHGRYFYAWSYWFQKGAKYALLAVLAGFILAKLIDNSDRRHIWIAAIILTAVTGYIVGLVYTSGITLPERLKDAGISANMFLVAIIGVAWFSREVELDEQWKWIARGLCLLLWSDGAMTAIWKAWEPASRFFWIGEVAALLIWNYAARGRFNLLSMRAPLGVRGEAVELSKAAGVKA